MALQVFGNYEGILLSPAPTFGQNSATSSGTMNAAGESQAAVGYVRLSTGPGTTKTLSSAGGGFIHWASAAVTFANAGTNVRVGINDVTSGLEDGTHDVYGDLTGGGGGIAANSVNRTAMTSGTKSITHGDLIAVVVEMTTRGGADSVDVTRGSSSSGFLVPYGTQDTGSGPTRVSGAALRAMIEFDDGTVGWLDGLTSGRFSSTSFASNSTPDEYALVFQLPCRASASGLWGALAGVASTEDFEMILYSDPLGTPVAERTISQDADVTEYAGGAQVFSRPFSSVYTLEANTTYAIALRPTTTSAISLAIMQLGTNGANIRKSTLLGTNWSQYTRTDQTGAFASQDTTILPLLGVWLSSLSDDVSAGGGGGRRPRLVTVR
jgi:hypothetical protein